MHSVTASLPLGSEGRHELGAEARDARGGSPRSNPVRIDYSAPAPGIAFTSPAPGAVLTVRRASR